MLKEYTNHNNMKKASVGIIILCIAIIGAFFLWRSLDKEPKTISVEKDPLVIGLSLGTIRTERWLKDRDFIIEKAKEMGAVVNVTMSDDNAEMQISQIENLISQGVKVIIVVSSDSEKLSKAVDIANNAGVKIIAYDRLITGSKDYDYYITFDNYKVGQFQGKAIESALKLSAATKAAPKYITLFAGSPTDNNAKVFFDGAIDVLRPYVEKGALVIVGPAPLKSSDDAFTKITTENWRADVAKTRMENLLNNDAKSVVLDAILAPNDTLARAIIEACSTDAKYPAGKLPVITGQDGEVASIAAIRDGKQNMTVFKDTRNLAMATIALADALLKGEEPSIKGARLDTTSYDTGKKVVKAYLLEPVIVTKDNYKTVLIDSGYYKEADIK